MDKALGDSQFQSQKKDRALLYVSLYVIFTVLIVVAFIFFVVIPRLKNRKQQIIQDSSSPSSVVPSSTTSNLSAVDQKLFSAKTNWAEGKYNQTLKDAEEALLLAKTNEDKAFSHYWAGVAYYKLNDLEKSISEEKISLGLLPKNSAPNVTLAAIALDQNNLTDALSYAQSAVDIDPNYSWAQNVFGLSLILNGRKEEGLVALKKANQLDPNNYVFKLNLTRAQSAN